MAIVWLTLMAMAFATFQTIALVSSMNVGFAMDKEFRLDNVIVKEMWMQMATVHAIISKLRVVWIQRPAISMNLLRLTTVLASTALVNFLPQGVTIWLLSLLPV